MNFGNLNYFLLFKANRNGFKKLGHSVGPGPAWGYSPRGWWPATNSARTAAWASVYRLGPLAKAVRPACEAHRGERAPGVVTALASAPRRHGQRDLAGVLGVAVVAASAPMELGGGGGQGGRGRSSPERRRVVESAEDASGGGVQRRRGSSGDG
jgi:hypothetical protein